MAQIALPGTRNCQFILINIRGTSGSPLYLPAKVDSRSGNNVRMVWHSGNIYPTAADRPRAEHFVIDARECLRAYYRSNTDMDTVFRPQCMGTISWPLLLNSDAVDELGFHDTSSVNALHKSMDRVVAILRGEVPHHMWAILERWWSRSSTTTLAEQTNVLVNLAMALEFPIFPAFESHIPPFLHQIEVLARNTSTFSNIHYHAIHYLSLILLRVVVSRFQLGQDTGNDDYVYLLAYQGPLGSLIQSTLSLQEQLAADGRLMRVPTVPEQAYASSIPGNVDTRISVIPSATGTLKRESTSVSLSEASPLLALLINGTPFAFDATPDGTSTTTNSSLPLPREFSFSLSASAPRPGPLPKPRPHIAGSVAVASTGSANAPVVLNATLDGSPLLRTIPCI
ncbi:hypothetical protein NMY22_g14247 [Coprinellus aureogranulatus]|nr:hypothetical protein NMY22_g14247 [Coprinellus aureogranulatus]